MAKPLRALGLTNVFHQKRVTAKEVGVELPTLPAGALAASTALSAELTTSCIKASEAWKAPACVRSFSLTVAVKLHTDVWPSVQEMIAFFGPLAVPSVGCPSTSKFCDEAVAAMPAPRSWMVPVIVSVSE